MGMGTPENMSWKLKPRRCLSFTLAWAVRIYRYVHRNITVSYRGPSGEFLPRGCWDIWDQETSVSWYSHGFMVIYRERNCWMLVWNPEFSAGTLNLHNFSIQLWMKRRSKPSQIASFKYLPCPFAWGCRDNCRLKLFVAINHCCPWRALIGIRIVTVTMASLNPLLSSTLHPYC